MKELFRYSFTDIAKKVKKDIFINVLLISCGYIPLVFFLMFADVKGPENKLFITMVTPLMTFIFVGIVQFIFDYNDIIVKDLIIRDNYLSIPVLISKKYYYVHIDINCIEEINLKEKLIDSIIIVTPTCKYVHFVDDHIYAWKLYAAIDEWFQARKPSGGALDGKLTSFICPNCGFEEEVLFSFVPDNIECDCGANICLGDEYYE